MSERWSLYELVDMVRVPVPYTSSVRRVPSEATSYSTLTLPLDTILALCILPECTQSRVPNARRKYICTNSCAQNRRNNR